MSCTGFSVFLLSVFAYTLIAVDTSSPAVQGSSLCQFVSAQKHVCLSSPCVALKLETHTAAGPSGMLADHLQPMLDTARDTSLLFQFASVLACGHASSTAVEAIRMGRITALRKPTGGVRGIIVGDVLRRLVARTMAKQMAVRVEAATAPFQYALTTKAGCESVAHILQSMTDQDERATIVSIDGVGAYDLISRNAMLEGLAAVPGGDRLLPFVRHFYGSPSTYLREDDSGKTHMIPQGEGGRTGRPVDALALQSRDAPRIGWHNADSGRQKGFSLSSTTFAWCAFRRGSRQLSTFWLRSCGRKLRSRSTTAGHKCGTMRARSQQAWRS